MCKPEENHIIDKDIRIDEVKSLYLNKFYSKKRTSVINGVNIRTFPSCSSLYKYFQFEDEYFVLYKLQYI